MDLRHVICVTTILIISCSGTAEVRQKPQRRMAHSTNPLNQKLRRVVDASNKFGINLYKELVSTKGLTENVFLSPVSISTALAMAYLGARGNCAQEMREGLRFDEAKLKDSDAHQAFHDLLEHLVPSSSVGNGSNYELNLANTALVQSEMSILDSYKTGLMKYYKAKIEKVNFIRDGPAIKDSVNKWVSNITKGRIVSLLSEPLHPDTALLLLNAVYFKGAWKSKFNRRRTIESVFYNNGETPKYVQTMRMKKKGLDFVTSKHLQSKILELSYVGDMSMVIILPRQRNGLQNLNSNLTARRLLKVISRLSPLWDEHIRVKLPRFKLEPGPYHLKNVLETLGMKMAFTKGLADFSGIHKHLPLQIDEVLHKAAIEVNEEGSTAAASTSVGITFYSAPRPINFKVDHPFMFLIRQRSTGLIVFMGCVNNL